MDFFENLIIGAGPAGVSAALKLEGAGTCIVDVAEKPSAIFPFNSFEEALSSGDVEELLGKNWDMLSNIRNPLRCHPKLRASAIRHVMQGEPYRVVGKDGELLVHGHGSFAAGGMANIWGAQLLRYTEDDLSGVAWPITASDLSPYFAELEAHIGISGAQDDMSSFLGATDNLLPPIPSVPVADYLLQKYEAKRKPHGVLGLRIGRPRLAVLTKPHRGRPVYNFGGTEFFTHVRGGIYNPQHTLSELCQRDKIRYLPGYKLILFKEHPDFVEVELEEIGSGQRMMLRTRNLLLGCGTIQTSKLVLTNRAQIGRTLPFIDHPPTFLPIIFPASFGSRMPNKSYPIQLIGTLEGSGMRDMISFYYPSGMFWSDLLSDIPMPMNIARSILSGVIGGMLVAQIWETSKPNLGNRICVEENGTVRIDYAKSQSYSRLPLLLSALRSLGGLSLGRLASNPIPSWGFHHAGTLPMARNPKAFETHTDGRLWDSNRVRIIDGSVLPSLPAKNHSLTIMANSARIAELVKLCEY